MGHVWVGWGGWGEGKGGEGVQRESSGEGSWEGGQGERGARLFERPLVPQHILGGNLQQQCWQQLRAGGAGRGLGWGVSLAGSSRRAHSDAAAAAAICCLLSQAGWRQLWCHI